jgi:hypothetical protein
MSAERLLAGPCDMAFDELSSMTGNPMKPIPPVVRHRFVFERGL